MSERSGHVAFDHKTPRRSTKFLRHANFGNPDLLATELIEGFSHMTMSRIGSRCGTAACVLGLSIIGLQTVGVASADSGSENSLAAAGSSATAPQRGAAAGPSRGTRVSRNAASQEAAARPGRGSGTAAAPFPLAAVRSHSDAAAATPAAPERASAAFTAAAPTANRSGSAELAVPATSSVRIESAASSGQGYAGTAGTASATTAAAAASTAAGPVGKVVSPVLNLSAQQSLLTPQQASVAVNRWLDSVQKALSDLGINPVTNLLQGALLLVRRSLFNQTPTAKAYEYALRANGELVGGFKVVDPEGAAVKYRVSGAPLTRYFTAAPSGSTTLKPPTNSPLARSAYS